MHLSACTDNLYDAVVALHEALFRGETEHTLRLTVRPDFRADLLQDFLCLVQEAEQDFKARIELEVVDEAQLLQ